MTKRVSVDVKVSTWYTQILYIPDDEYSNDWENDLLNKTFNMDAEELDDPDGSPWNVNDCYIDDVSTHSEDCT